MAQQKTEKAHTALPAHLINVALMLVQHCQLLSKCTQSVQHLLFLQPHMQQHRRSYIQARGVPSEGVAARSAWTHRHALHKQRLQSSKRPREGGGGAQGHALVSPPCPCMPACWF